MIVTDYPDTDLIENLAHNVAGNVQVEERKRVDVQVRFLKTCSHPVSLIKFFDKGYIWGRPVHPLLEPLSLSSPKFDLIILSDLIFNHSQVH